MKTQIGKMVTGDFQENTITFEIVGSDAVLQAGKYALVPIDDYNKLIGSDDKKQESYINFCPVCDGKNTQRPANSNKSWCIDCQELF